MSPLQKYILRLSSKIKTELEIFVVIYSYCYNQQGCQLSAFFSLFLPALAHLSLLFAAYTSLSSSLSLLPPTLICIVAPSWRHPVLKDSLTATKTFRGSCSSFLALSPFLFLSLSHTLSCTFTSCLGYIFMRKQLHLSFRMFAKNSPLVLQVFLLPFCCFFAALRKFLSLWAHFAYCYCRVNLNQIVEPPLLPSLLCQHTHTAHTYVGVLVVLCS